LATLLSEVVCADVFLLKKPIFEFFFGLFDCENSTLPRASDEFQDDQRQEQLAHQERDQVDRRCLIDHTRQHRDRDRLEKYDRAQRGLDEDLAVHDLRVEVDRVNEEEIVLVYTVAKEE